VHTYLFSFNTSTFNYIPNPMAKAITILVEATKLLLEHRLIITTSQRS
jgi:hypothetical protein